MLLFRTTKCKANYSLSRLTAVVAEEDFAEKEMLLDFQDFS